MTKDEYRDAIARLGMSQVKAGELIGVNPRTSRRWALGEDPVPKVVAHLLRLMIQHKISPDGLVNE